MTTETPKCVFCGRLVSPPCGSSIEARGCGLYRRLRGWDQLETVKNDLLEEAEAVAPIGISKGRVTLNGRTYEKIHFDGATRAISREMGLLEGEAATEEFYRRVHRLLVDSKVPFLWATGHGLQDSPKYDTGSPNTIDVKEQARLRTNSYSEPETTPEERAEARAIADGMRKLISDPVVLPDHYVRWKIEPITFIRENNLPFWMGNVIKYVMRAEFKNGLEDLKKARRYIDMEIKKQEGDESWAK